MNASNKLYTLSELRNQGTLPKEPLQSDPYYTLYSNEGKGMASYNPFTRGVLGASTQNLQGTPTQNLQGTPGGIDQGMMDEAKRQKEQARNSLLTGINDQYNSAVSSFQDLRNELKNRQQKEFDLSLIHI